MNPAIVVAPHPDDEVLGASEVLTAYRCTVIHVTDGVPRVSDVADLATTRIAESRAAWETLGARVDAHIRLGFTDQCLSDQLDAVAHSLAAAIAEHDGDVYVPAYQRGHPDHDALYVAAQIARVELQTTEMQNRRWCAYALYGLDHHGRPRYAWLDPDYFPDSEEHGNTPEALERKRVALGEFASQLSTGAVLWRWLDNPVPERYGDLPAHHVALPHPRCFYEEIFRFSDFGIDADTITAVLEAALARLP